MVGKDLRMMVGRATIYRGRRTTDGCRVEKKDLHGEWQDLPPRNDLRNHSPDGFNWGYCGSGPAQLALALVADATRNDELTHEVYQRVKELLVAELDGPIWLLTSVDVLGAVQQAMRE